MNLNDYTSIPKFFLYDSCYLDLGYRSGKKTEVRIPGPQLTIFCTAR